MTSDELAPLNDALARGFDVAKAARFRSVKAAASARYGLRESQE